MKDSPACDNSPLTQLKKTNKKKQTRAKNWHVKHNSAKTMYHPFHRFLDEKRVKEAGVVRTRRDVNDLVRGGRER